MRHFRCGQRRQKEGKAVIDFYTRVIDSELGPLTAVATRGQAVGVFFEGHRRAPVVPGLGPIARLSDVPPARAEEQPHNAEALDEVEGALRDYLGGGSDARTPRVAWRVPEGIGTEFQRATWAALAETEWGSTITYGELAAAIGRPQAVRAVGAAVGANPLSILVPCHRVVGAGGALTGYAGGIERKTWLLAHESGRGTL